MSSKFRFLALYPKTITRNFPFTFGIRFGSESSDFGAIAVCTILKKNPLIFSKSIKAFNWA